MNMYTHSQSHRKTDSQRQQNLIVPVILYSTELPAISYKQNEINICMY